MSQFSSQEMRHISIAEPRLAVKRSSQSLAPSQRTFFSDTSSIPPIPHISTDYLLHDDEEHFPKDIEQNKPQDGPPDGGFQAWLVTFGTFCALISSFGWLNSVGVFQDYYQKHFLQDYSKSQISWISSVQVMMIFSGGIIFGKLFDNNGPFWLLTVGTFLQVFGIVITAGSDQYYQFFLAQAFCSSIGASCIYYAAAGSIITWFSKRRATAFGLAATGASLGGVVFPIMVNNLVNRIGFPWTMRAIAGILLVLNIIVIFTVKSRLVHTHKPFSPHQYLVQLKDIPFVVLLVGMSIFSLGLWLPLNFLITQGQAAGMSLHLSQYLIPILNAASVFGRFVPGILGDKFGRLNVLFIATITSGVLTLALWIPAKNNLATIIFAGLYGFFSGAYVSLGPSVVAQVSDVKEIGLRSGVLYFVVGMAVLVGNPIGGQLVSAMHGSFLGLQLFAGVTMVVGALIILLARFLIAGVGFKVV
ncbi:hypothetical protein N0V90_012483 [Kalmusia sp. IMI 367209]|nr:hypothetical protein N0V90_012483 [Kalmusia sp. IMI 367209]